MAERFKFSQSRVRELQATPGKQTEYYDEEQKRLGIRVSSKGRKTFFILKRINGRLIRVTVGLFPDMNVDDARKKTMELLLEMDKGVNPNLEKKQLRELYRDKSNTLSAVFDRFMKDGMERIDKPFRPDTIRSYRYNFKHLAEWHRLRVEEITPGMVRARHKNLGASSGKYAANRTMALLKLLFNHAAIELGRKIDNPAAGLKMFTESPRRGRLEADHVPGFFKAIADVPGNTCKDLFTLLIFTGLRKSDAMSLRWENLDLEKKSLHIVTSKTDNPLDIPLASYLADLLKARKAASNSPWVFPTQSRSGHATNTSMFVREIKSRGVTVYPHLLRKTFTTIATAVGCPAVYTDTLTSHVPRGITDRHYIWPSVEEMRLHVEAIAAEILRRAVQCPEV